VIRLVDVSRGEMGRIEHSLAVHMREGPMAAARLPVQWDMLLLVVHGMEMESANGRISLT
jgi:hypothetical protein